MFGQDGSEKVGAELSGGQRGHEDVRVKEDRHDTSLNTSSSVSSPWASAKGATISSRVNHPRSPPLGAVPSSIECSTASVAKSAPFWS